jgi:hypothetical protein
MAQRNSVYIDVSEEGSVVTFRWKKQEDNRKYYLVGPNKKSRSFLQEVEGSGRWWKRIIQLINEFILIRFLKK